MPSAKRLAVVVNPTKFADLDQVREGVAKACADHGWGDPIVLETTVEDPGVGQAQQAVDEGVDVVASLGGDGTVRAVATSLVGTHTPIGLLPGGTGNLLARNLGVPVDSLRTALNVVLTGEDRRIDVGLVRMLPDSSSADAYKGDSPPTPDDPRAEDEEVFLVMAGIGVDAEVMANTDERVKGVLGWRAYVFTGLGRLLDKGFMVRLTVGAEKAQVQHARSLIIGNCGSLQGGVDLIPEAKVDDGLLDAVVLSPEGVLGWGALVASLVSRHRRGHPTIGRYTGGRFLATTGEDRIEAQIDGDPKGAQYGFAARILPASLSVRVPSTETG